MQTILLNRRARRHLQAIFAFVDDEDLALVNQFSWSILPGNKTMYACTCDAATGKHFPMHRLILGIKDPKIITDHIDRNGLNNQKHNLRICSKPANACNTGLYKTNTSGFKGVHFNKTSQTWQARIRINGKRISLGYYSTAEEANKAYSDADEIRQSQFYNS